MKLTVEEKLPIYRRNLLKYEAENDPMADVQRQLVQDLERELSKAKPK